jgi:cysteine synthase B
MIREAMIRGQLKPGMKMVEPTSGNTGIAMAMVARTLGIELELAMPENSTKERVQTMRAYGAKVVLTPAKAGIEGSRDYA